MFFKGYGIIGNLTFAFGMAFPIWAVYEAKRMGENSLPIHENDAVYNLIKKEERKKTAGGSEQKADAKKVQIIRKSSKLNLEPDI